MSKLEKLKQELKTRRDWKSVEEVENFFDESLDTAYELGREERNKDILLDQLYRLEGILSKYNCQHGGTKCNFQTNCHRLIRKEIDLIKTLNKNNN